MGGMQRFCILRSMNFRSDPIPYVHATPHAYLKLFSFHHQQKQNQTNTNSLIRADQSSPNGPSK